MALNRRRTILADTQRPRRGEREEVINTNYYSPRRRSQTVWVAVALVLLVFLLLFLWSRNATRTSPTQVNVNESPNAQSSQRNPVDAVRTGLADVSRKLSENGDYDQAAQSVERIRQNFRTSSQNAGESQQSSWQGIDNELNTIETQLRSKSINVGEVINKLIDSLKNVRLDVNVPQK